MKFLDLSIPLCAILAASTAACDPMVPEIQPEPIASIKIQPASNSSPTEAILSINYRIKCDATQGIRTLHGFTRVQNRIIRFDLFEATNRTEVSLGQISKETQIELNLKKNDHCKLLSLEKSISLEPVSSADSDHPLKQLALAHSPYINIRNDQYDNRDTDIPLLMVYNIATADNDHVLIQYTTFFSDEDSKTSLSETEGQMDRYGRRTDIEWTYLVEFDGSRKIVRRSYQGGFSPSALGSGADFGHSFQEFKGSFLPGSEHPILYNTASNNVFDDEPSSEQRRLGLVGYHLVPRDEVLSPRAREWAMMNHPWIYKASDDELTAEGKLHSPSTDYLFILIDGELRSGAFIPQLQLTSDFWSTHESDVDRLGEDMWHRQALSAIRVGSDRIDDLLDGKWKTSLVFTSTSLLRSADLDISSVRFFRLKSSGATYEVQEITEKLPNKSCMLKGIESRCTF